MIGHGETEGRFTEINGLEIARDTRFPVRITAQFYKATSNGVVTGADVAALREQIDRVYDDATMWKSPTLRPASDGLDPQHHAERSPGPWARPVWEWYKAQ